MAGLRDVLLGATGQVIRPDATEDFSASIEAGSVCRIRTGTVQPFGESGEGVLRRIYVQGYHRASVRVFITPIVDGRYRADLTVYLSLAAPLTGRLDRFSLVAPIAAEQSDYPGSTISPRGTAFAADIEVREPLARLYLTSVVPVFEPLAAVRTRGVRE